METISNAMMALENHENHEYVEMEEAGSAADPNIPSMQGEAMVYNDFNASSVEAHTDGNNNKEYDGKGHEIGDDDNENNKMRSSTTNSATQKKQKRPNPNPTGKELLNHCCGSCVTCYGILSLVATMYFALFIVYLPIILFIIFYIDFAMAHKDFRAQDDECDLSNRLRVHFLYCTFCVFSSLFNFITEFACKGSVWYKRRQVLDAIIYIGLLYVGFCATVDIPPDSTCPILFPDYVAASRHMLYCNIATGLFWTVVGCCASLAIIGTSKHDKPKRKGNNKTPHVPSPPTSIVIPTIPDAKDTPLLPNSKDIENGASTEKNQPESADREEEQELGRE